MSLDPRIVQALQRARWDDVPGCVCGPTDCGCAACDTHLALAVLTAAVAALPDWTEPESCYLGTQPQVLPLRRALLLATLTADHGGGAS